MAKAFFILKGALLSLLFSMFLFPVLWPSAGIKSWSSCSSSCCFCSGHKFIAISALVFIILLSFVKLLHFVVNRMVNILISLVTKFFLSLFSSTSSLNSSGIGSKISIQQTNSEILSVS